MNELETPEEEHKRKPTELEGKNIAHYSVMLAAYISARTDANKAIFAFSSAGVGVLVALADKLLLANSCTKWLYLISVVALLLSVISTMFVHVANAKTIESYITQVNEKDKQFKLKKYTYINYILFGIGIVFMVVALFHYGLNNLTM